MALACLAPKTRPKLYREITTISAADRNALNPSPVSLESSSTREAGGYKLSCYQGGPLLWQDSLPAPVCSLAGNDKFAAAGCIDGSLYVYSPGGRRLFPAMMLSSAPSILEASRAGAYLVALCALGELRVWDLDTAKEILRTDATSVLGGPGESVSRVSLGADGIPTIHTARSGSYRYHMGLQTWLRLHDANFLQSNFFQSTPSSSGSGGFGSTMGILAEAQAALRLQATTAHLETELLAVCHTGPEGSALSPESQEWLLAYVRHLAQGGLESRLREIVGLCRGTPGLGLPKGIHLPGEPEAFLKAKIFPIMSSNRGLQRLVQELTEAGEENTEPIMARGAVAILGEQ